MSLNTDISDPVVDPPISEIKGRALQSGVATSAELSVMTGTGLVGFIVGVPLTVKVQAKDVNNVAKTTGGDIF